MANNLTIAVNDSGFNMSTGTNIAVVSTTTTGDYKYRFLIEVTYNTQINTPLASKTISFTQQKNQEGLGIFNLSEIYRSIVTPQITSAFLDNVGESVPYRHSSIHTMPYFNGANQLIFSAGLIGEVSGYESFRGVANVLFIKFWEYYATTPDGIPAKQGTATSKDIYLLYGRGEADDPIIYDFSPYELSSTTKKFLSSNYNFDGTQYNINIGKEEYHTMAFLNRNAVNTSAQPYYIRVRFFNTSGAFISTLTLQNNSQAGGDYASTPSDLANEKFYLFVGVGLKNLSEIDNTLSPYTGDVPSNGSVGGQVIGSYEVSATTSGNAQVSYPYIFNIIEYCTMYEQSRLCYMNKFGAWDYITLNKDKEEEIKIHREYITKPLLNQANNLGGFGDEYLNASYPPDVAKQGKMTTSVKTDYMFTLFTDNLKDYEIDQIQDLMMSPQIHLLDGDNAKALVLETSNMKLKGAKNTGLYQYELKFRFANPKYRTI